MLRVITDNNIEVVLKGNLSSFIVKNTAIMGVNQQNATPLVDIKSHLPGYNSAANAGVALWITKL